MSDPPHRAAFERRYVLSGSRRDLEEVERSVLGEVERRGYGRAGCFAIRLALQEAISNAIHHGNKDHAAKRIVVHCRVDDHAVVLEVEDEGEGFDPSAVPDPTQPENIEIPSGRGIVLMRAYMSDVRFCPPGNRVRMEYRRGS